MKFRKEYVFNEAEYTDLYKICYVFSKIAETNKELVEKLATGKGELKELLHTSESVRELFKK